MIPYVCLSTGSNVGLIEVVQDSKTVMKIQGASLSGGIQLNSRELHKWIRDKNREKDKSVSPLTLFLLILRLLLFVFPEKYKKFNFLTKYFTHEWWKSIVN